MICLISLHSWLLVANTEVIDASISSGNAPTHSRALLPNNKINTGVLGNRAASSFSI